MRVISFEEACVNRGYDPAAILPDVSMVPEKHQKAILATLKMYVIAEAINDGHMFNWGDYDEDKWMPWFDLEVNKKNNPSGFRFYDTYYDCTYTYSAGGSRLCYRTSEDAKFAGETFLDLYRDMMVVPK